MQVPEWIDYWPAIKYGRYWKAGLSLAIGGAITGAMLLGVVWGAVGVWDKLFAEDLAAGFGSRLNSMRGSAWLTFVFSSWCAGLALYAARRVWIAERESDHVERLRSIRLDRLGLDGYAVFAQCGVLLNVDMAGAEWITKSYQEILRERAKGVFIAYLGAGARAIPDSMTMEDHAVARTRVSEVLDVLRQHNLVRSSSPTDVLPHFRKYVLTESGEIELNRAQRYTEASKPPRPERAADRH